MKRIPKYALTILVLVSFIGLFFWQREAPGNNKALTIEQKNQVKSSALASDEKEKGEESATLIVVDVKGEVIHPGVYELEGGERVQDAIEVAGGMTDQADPLSVNLAQKLLDEMVIYVTSAQKGGQIMNGSYADKLSVNQASIEELKSLSGIGEAKAKKIINYRDDHGPLESVDELLEISGIGNKTLEGFRDDIRVP